MKPYYLYAITFFAIALFHIFQYLKNGTKQISYSDWITIISLMLVVAWWLISLSRPATAAVMVFAASASVIFRLRRLGGEPDWFSFLAPLCWAIVFLQLAKNQFKLDEKLWGDLMMAILFVVGGIIFYVSVHSKFRRVQQVGSPVE